LTTVEKTPLPKLPNTFDRNAKGEKVEVLPAGIELGVCGWGGVVGSSAGLSVEVAHAVTRYLEGRWARAGWCVLVHQQEQ
jgi:hypothetical protein